MSSDNLSIRFRHLVILIPLFLVASCATKRSCEEVCSSSGPATAAATRATHQPAHAPYVQRDELIRGFRDALKNTGPMGVSMLALSGGGSRGAFGAGVLAGWNISPQIPFTIVTGISTGGLIAPFAFIGDFESLKYHDYHTRDIHRKRWWIELPFSSAMYNPNNLSQLIWKFMDEDGFDLMGKVNQAHSQNTDRMLFVGTVNMDNGAFCAWPMHIVAERALSDDAGEVYRRAYRRLFHDVLYATTVVPAIYPPIEITSPDPTMCASGMHADGGIRQGAFVKFAEDVRLAWEASFIDPVVNVAIAAEPPAIPNPPAYVIVSKKLVPRKTCVDDGILPIGLRGLEVLLKAAQIGNLYQIRAKLTEQGTSSPWLFKLAHIPDDYKLTFSSEEFIPEELEKLYEEGRNFDTQMDWSTDIPETQISPLDCDE